MKKHLIAARGLSAFAFILCLGFGLADAGAAKAESRGAFDAATSLSVGAASGKEGSTAKTAATRTLGFTGSTGTQKITVSAARATARTSRFGDDASLPAGGGSPAPRTESAAKAAGFTAGKPFESQIARHARANGVPVSLAMAVVRVESNYNPKVRGSAGEIGLMQIKPLTARGMGFSGAASALYDPETNLRWGMKYLAGAYKRAGGDTCGTIMRYQGGHYATRMSRVAVGYCAKVKSHMAGKWA